MVLELVSKSTRPLKWKEYDFMPDPLRQLSRLCRSKDVLKLNFQFTTGFVQMCHMWQLWMVIIQMAGLHKPAWANHWSLLVCCALFFAVKKSQQYRIALMLFPLYIYSCVWIL